MCAHQPDHKTTITTVSADRQDETNGKTGGRRIAGAQPAGPKQCADGQLRLNARAKEYFEDGNNAISTLDDPRARQALDGGPIHGGCVCLSMVREPIGQATHSIAVAKPCSPTVVLDRVKNDRLLSEQPSPGSPRRCG